jgi:hypothetical protein
VDGRKREVRFSIWSVADLFLSLSDNVQETYGLTPLEAMAAGLPCVVSDWDGYRESVRHNVDGFRISTYAPRAGAGRDLAYRHSNGWDNYSQYIGAASQMTAVDISEATNAIYELAINPDLRQRMGAAGREHAQSTLDWKVLIPKYEALWREQNNRRLAAAQEQPRRNTADDPYRLDPFRLFASYPTEWLTPTTTISLSPSMTPAKARAILNMKLANYTPWVLPNAVELEQLYEALALRPKSTVAEVLAQFPIGKRQFLERGLLWLAKYGVSQVHGMSHTIPD